MIPLAALAIVAALFAFREHGHARSERAWANERQSLIHAAVSKTPGEYAVMERAHNKPAEVVEIRRQPQVGSS